MTRDIVYFRHILDAIITIERYVEVGREPFLSESLRQDAAIRQLEIIGEATKRLSSAFRLAHPEVPWQRMAGMRDVLIHGYDDVDLAIVWRVTQQSLPDLKIEIASLITALCSSREQ